MMHLNLQLRRSTQDQAESRRTGGVGAGKMAQPAAARPAHEGGQIQTRQTTGTNRLAETNPDGTRGTKEATASGPGAVAAAVSECQGRVGSTAEPRAGTDGEVSAERGYQCKESWLMLSWLMLS